MKNGIFSLTMILVVAIVLQFIIRLRFPKHVPIFSPFLKSGGNPGHFPMSREFAVVNGLVENINQGIVDVRQGKFQKVARNIVVSKPL